MSPSGCPSPVVLAAHARGKLDPATLSKVDTHLAACERCQLAVLFTKRALRLHGKRQRNEFGSSN